MTKNLNNKGWRPLILSLVLVVLGGGCSYDPLASSLTTKEPKLADVAGVYVLDYQTLAGGHKDFPEWKGRKNWSPELNLKPDGTYEMKEFPAWGFHSVFLGYSSQSGEWAIKPSGMLNDRHTTYGIRFDGHRFFKPEGYMVSGLGLLHNKPSHRLRDCIGDPDMGDNVVYKLK